MGGPLRRIALIERLAPRSGGKVFGRARGWISKLTLECGHPVYREAGKTPRTRVRCEVCTMENIQVISRLARKHGLLDEPEL